MSRTPGAAPARRCRVSDTGFADYSDERAAADYLALVDDVDAGPAVLVGNSLSCASAVIAAADSPDCDAGIVLLGPFARPAPITWWQRALFTVMLVGPSGRSAWVAYYRRAISPGRNRRTTTGAPPRSRQRSPSPAG